MIPRVTLLFELEARPLLRVEAESAEDEARILAWIDELDLEHAATLAAERLAALRDRHAA